MSDLLEGVQLSDFLLTQCIGRGGVADVYRGRHVGLDGGRNYDVAVKVYRPGFAHRETFRDYFMTEAEKIGQFEHPNILPFLEFGEGETLLYAVTPFIEGGTLGDLLNRVGGKFSAMQALPIMQQLCSAIQYAHERDAIHGNIKLSNIFVGTDGRMLLADFGIVRGYDDSQQSITRIGWGSAEFAAPEQSLGVLRPSTDIYALGALLFRILTGQPPYTGQTPVEVLLKHVRLRTPSARSIDPNISDAVDEVLQRAMQKRSEDRYPSAMEFFTALQTAVTVAPVASPVARAVPRAAITRQLSSTTGGLPDAYTNNLQGAAPAPGLTSATRATDPTGQFNRSGFYEVPLQQMSPIGEPTYAEDAGGSNRRVRRSDDIGGTSQFLLDDDDAGTHLFWSVDPQEWSPIGNEQAGSVPLTAEDYLRSMPVAPAERPIKSIEVPAPGETAVPVQPAQMWMAEAPKTTEAVPSSRLPDEQVVTVGRQTRTARLNRKNLLPVLVVILLLLGLLGALLSSFVYSGSPGGSTNSRPGVTSTPGGAVTSTTSNTPTPGATGSPAAGSPTATVSSTATATTTPRPSPSPTPIPIPTNPAVPQFACASGALGMDGSASFVPAIQQLTGDYNSQCANSVNFSYNPDESQNGLQDLVGGSVDLAYSDLPSAGRAGLVGYQVAALIFAVVVNSDTQITNLTTDQLKGIYTGRITNWSQVGGSNEPIVILTQPAGSTLRMIFETYVLGGVAQTVTGVTSGASVAGISGGITYMPLAEAPTPGSTAQSISLNGIGATFSDVESGAYPFWSVERLYTKGAAQGVASSFISFCLSTMSINDLASSGAVPYNNMSETALRSHLPSPTI